MPEAASTSHGPLATSQQATHNPNGTKRYVYNPANRRVWKQEPSRTLVYFYGVEGNLLATYGDQSNTDYNVYFAGKLIWAEASTDLPARPRPAPPPVTVNPRPTPKPPPRTPGWGTP